MEYFSFCFRNNLGAYGEDGKVTPTLRNSRGTSSHAAGGDRTENIMHVLRGFNYQMRAFRIDFACQAALPAAMDRGTMRGRGQVNELFGDCRAETPERCPGAATSITYCIVRIATPACKRRELRPCSLSGARALAARLRRPGLWEHSLPKGGRGSRAGAFATGLPRAIVRGHSRGGYRCKEGLLAQGRDRGLTELAELCTGGFEGSVHRQE